LAALQNINEEQVRALRAKAEEIFTVQRQSLQKDEEISKLRMDIRDYSIRINSLTEELDRSERSQKLQTRTETIRYVESEDSAMLKVRNQ
jgi:predicted RNase H-like nuclease (RuvC/YqgF family)